MWESAQEEESFMKANQRVGITEVSAFEQRKQLFRSRPVIISEVALRFFKPCEESVEGIRHVL